MEDWEQSLQALHKLFLEASDDTCLLWVNPAQGDPFEDDALARERRVPVPISHPRFDPRFAPYLLPLTLHRFADADIFKRSVQLAWQSWSLDSLNFANGQPIGGWVVTSRPPAELARHWADHCHLHLRGGLTKLLRFHDPSVREWLWPTLSPAQRRQLLGPDFHTDERLLPVWKLTAAGEFYGGAIEDVTQHAADQLHRYLTQLA